ncbi:MFS transporter [Puniceicoccaceae bacterium K14]|nr:MFS transporter [Puniceicoccaceae bacterium K14]
MRHHSRKAGCGFLEVGLSAMELMLQVYLLELYLTAGLSPIYAGSALAIAAIWDALSDPIMGSISDSSKSDTAMGKRLVFMFPGVVLAAISFYYLFSPSSGLTEMELFLRLIVSYLILNTGLTLLNVPYLALINDLSSTSEERAAYFGWRMVFSGIGLMVGLSIPVIVGQTVNDAQVALGGEGLLTIRADAGFWICIVLVISFLVSIFSVWKVCSERIRNIDAGLRVLEATRTALRSKGFINVVCAFVFISIGRAFNGSLALIFYKGTLNLSENEVATVLVGLSVVIIVSTPIWISLSKRYEKRRLCAYGSFALTLLTAVAYPLLSEGATYSLAVVVFLGGFSVASVVLLELLFSDVIEKDGEEVGWQVSGAYYGLWRFGTKFARAWGLGVAGLFLGLIGFEKGTIGQTQFVERAVAWGFGPGVALFFFLGTYFIWRESKRLPEFSKTD